MTPLLFKDAPSGYEIVLLRSRGVPLGVAYDPLRATMPVPWHRDCHHCTAGRQPGLSIQVKRAIQMLRTQEISDTRASYVVPTNSRPNYVTYWTEDGVLRACVACEPEGAITISAEPNCKIIFNTLIGREARELQAPILRRCLQILFSAREASIDEVRAAIRPLLERQRIKGIPSGRQNPCNTIRWSEVMVELCGDRP